MDCVSVSEALYILPSQLMVYSSTAQAMDSISVWRLSQDEAWDSRECLCSGQDAGRRVAAFLPDFCVTTLSRISK